MDDTKKILRTIVNGQSAMKSELLGEIQKVNVKIDSLDIKVENLSKKTREGFKEVNQRIDKLGMQIAHLEDDSPTIEEFDKLQKRVAKLEHKASFGLK